MSQGYEVIVRITTEKLTINIIMDPGTKEHRLRIMDNDNAEYILDKPIHEDDIANIAAGFKNAFNILDGGLE